MLKISRGKATMDILKFKRDQYDANNSNNTPPTTVFSIICRMAIEVQMLRTV